MLMQDRRPVALVLAILMLFCMQNTSEGRKFGVDSIPEEYAFDIPDEDHTTIGIALDEAKQRELAVKAFRSAAKFTPSAVTYGNLGVVLMRMEEFAESFEYITKALTLDPTNPTLKSNLKDLENMYTPETFGASSKKETKQRDGHVPNRKSKQKAMPMPNIDVHDIDFYEEDDYDLIGSAAPSRDTTDRVVVEFDGDEYDLKDDDVAVPQKLPEKTILNQKPSSSKRPSPLLRTIDPSKAYTLADLPDRPVIPIISHNSYPNAPSKVIKLSGRRAVYDFIASDDFRTAYYQQFPLIIHTNGAFLDVLTIADALQETYGYRADKDTPPYKNVRYIKGSFNFKQDENGPQKPRALAKALRQGYTLQLYGIQKWIPSVASVCLQLSKLGIKLPVNVNLYITPGGSEVSLIPHSDYQCSLMVQLAGKKRWKLWVKPGRLNEVGSLLMNTEISVPTHGSFVRGRDDDDKLSEKELGKPYIDVVLEAGDILYVPRGVIHATSTPESPVPSMHMTVGMEALWDQGLSQTWFNMFGGGMLAHHDLMHEGWFKALRNLVSRDIEFRKTLPFEIYEEHPGGDWKEKARALMHQLVDEMVDGTDTLDLAREALKDTIDLHNWRLENQFHATTEIAIPDTNDVDSFKKGAIEWYKQWQSTFRRKKQKNHDEL